MQYLGGKSRLAKNIAEIIHLYYREGITYIEPFVGAASVASKVKVPVSLCYDVNPYLIAMYNELKLGWLPPRILTFEEYSYIREHKDENKALTAFVGFGCSFAGKWFGGYARSVQKKNYCLLAHNSLTKKFLGLRNKFFDCKNYKELNPQGSLIYCDPPYDDVTGYSFGGNFNSEEFWDIMRKWSSNNTVLVSEYKAPSDFKCIAEFKTANVLRNGANIRVPRTEKIFKYDSY